LENELNQTDATITIWFLLLVDILEKCVKLFKRTTEKTSEGDKQLQTSCLYLKKKTSEGDKQLQTSCLFVSDSFQKSPSKIPSIWYRRCCTCTCPTKGTGDDKKSLGLGAQDE
jgi:hypothetical protein